MCTHYLVFCFCYSADFAFTLPCVSTVKIVILNDNSSSHGLSCPARHYAKPFTLSHFILTVTLWVRCYYYVHFPVWRNRGSGRFCHLPKVSVQCKWQSWTQTEVWRYTFHWPWLMPSPSLRVDPTGKQKKQEQPVEEVLEELWAKLKWTQGELEAQRAAERQRQLQVGVESKRQGLGQGLAGRPMMHSHPTGPKFWLFHRAGDRAMMASSWMC